MGRALKLLGDREGAVAGESAVAITRAPRLSIESWSAVAGEEGAGGELTSDWFFEGPRCYPREKANWVSSQVFGRPSWPVQPFLAPST